MSCSPLTSWRYTTGTRPSLHRFEDAYRVLEWRLARKPSDAGTPVRQLEPLNLRVHVQEADPVAGTPEIRVLYSFDRQKVDIHRLYCPEAE